MGLNLEYIPGQTPVDEEEMKGLLISSIATRGELDEFEQQNIEQAYAWLWTQNVNPEQLFTEKFVKELHRRMYGEVWSWAGQFRKTDKNIGVNKWQIGTELKHLLDDTKYWLHNGIYPADELALRFKHRLVSIHCFSNGNGRHSRLMADIIAEKIFKLSPFTWGAASLSRQTDSRNIYLRAVKAADTGDIKPLLAFSRS